MFNPYHHEQQITPESKDMLAGRLHIIEKACRVANAALEHDYPQLAAQPTVESPMAEAFDTPAISSVEFSAAALARRQIEESYREAA